MKKGILYILLISLPFGQIVYHQPVHVAHSNMDLHIEAVIESGDSNIEQALILFRKYSHFDFIHIEMNHEYGNLWSGKIPAGFLQDDMIEYYIMAISYSGGIASYPYFEPEQNPLRTRLEHFKRSKLKTDNTSIVEQSDMNIEKEILGGEESNALILSPDDGGFVLLNDILIAVSLMSVEDVDYSSLSVKINNKDFSESVNVQGDIVSVIPKGLGAGKYNVKMIIRDRNGGVYKPLKWSFFAVTSELKTTAAEFKQSGKIAADHTHAEIDQQGFSISNLNMEWKGIWDFGHLKVKSKMTSLENPLEQPRNRYSAYFTSPHIKLKLGDVNPNINEYAFNGYRVRGFNFELDSRYLDANYVQGQVIRPIQGDPDFDAMFIDWEKSSLRTIQEQIDDSIGIVLDTVKYTLTEFISEVNNQEFGTKYFSNITDSIHFIYNRSDYEFEQQVNAFNLGLGSEEKFRWNLNIIKVKDNYNTVNNMLGNSNIWMPAYINTNYYQDIDSTLDVVIDTLFQNYYYFEQFINYDSLSFNPNLFYDVSVSDYSIQDTIENFDQEGEYNINYYFDTYVDSSFYYQFKFAEFYENYYNLFHDSLNFTYEILNKDWGGMAPQDNFIIGSDFKLAFDNQKIRLKAGFAFSMYNQNIWDPVITKDALDTLLDDYDDEYIGREYYNGDYPNGGIEFPGISLDEINFDPERYSKYFHMNFNQLPIIPIDISTGSPGLNEILTMPSMLYHYNLRMYYGGHSFNYGFRQVGPEFHSLVNPFIQKNIRERQISDRVGLMSNRLYLNYKWKNSIDGIDPTVNDLMKTNNHDFNISLYPGIGMPSFTFGMGTQDRSNGKTVIDTSEADGTLSFSGEHTGTRKLNILMTSQIKFFGSHNITFNIFESKKTDYLVSTHLLANSDYLSQSSTNKSYSLNIKSKINQLFDVSSFMNLNKYTLGEGESFQEQNVILLDFSGIYKRGKNLKYIKNGINFTRGTGSSTFSQFSYKLGLEYRLIEYMILRTNYELRYKIIAGNNSNINSMLILNLGYKF